jgi:hypothetical protein
VLAVGRSLQNSKAEVNPMRLVALAILVLSAAGGVASAKHNVALGPRTAEELAIEHPRVGGRHGQTLKVEKGVSWNVSSGHDRRNDEDVALVTEKQGNLRKNGRRRSWWVREGEIEGVRVTNVRNGKRTDTEYDVRHGKPIQGYLNRINAAASRAKK